jgi:hypothetical protein
LCLALLEWRNTPIKDMGSPAQLAFGRRTRTILPNTTNQLRPKPVTVKLTDVLAGRQAQQKLQYDKHTRSDREILKPGEQVRVRTQQGWLPGKVVQSRSEPRSYDIERNSRVYRRNRRDIQQVPQSSVPQDNVEPKHNVNLNQSRKSVKVNPISKPVVQPTVPNIVNKPVAQNCTPNVVKPTCTMPQTVTRSGRAIRQPAHLKEFVK